MKIKKVLAFLTLCVFLSSNSWAYWVWSPEAGKFVNPEKGGQDSAEEHYDFALQIYRENDLDSAQKLFEELIQKFPTSPVAPEAQYRLGRIEEDKKDYAKAFKAYRRLLKTYPQSERINEVIERQYRLGNLFLSGKKGKLMGFEIMPALPMAVEVFQHIVEVAPYSEYGDKAQFRLGLSYKKWGRFDQAQEAFQGLLDQYPRSPLVADARFQIAESSFLKSSVEFRDQRALDEAAQEVDRFLAYYQDTSASEEAVKIRQHIDEKNAEKNYRIGLYYEKQDYLESALIYYTDIAKRYPHTQWGQKAQKRMKSLKEPVSFLSSEEEKIEAEIKKTEIQLQALPKKDSNLEREQLERHLKRLEQREKSIEQSKEDSLSRRSKDIRRRERELKQKFKNLEKKKKRLLKKNPSEDLQRAFDRWTASLESEQAALAEEKMQLGDWRHELGMRQERFFSLEFLPFVGDEGTPLEQVHQLDAKEFYKISNEKKALLEEKELLYKQYSEIVMSLRGVEAESFGVAQEGLSYQAIAEHGGGELKTRRERLETTLKDIQSLEAELIEKRNLYEDRFGQGLLKKMVNLPVQAVAVPTKMVVRSLDLLNPFSGSDKPLEEQPIEALLEQRMHVKEKIAAQRSLVETLNQAFDAELALQERKRLLSMLERQDDIDPSELRRMIKRKEKDIRNRYEEIQDRHEKKKKLLKQLDTLLKNDTRGPMAKTAGAVASPVVGMAKMGKAFLFGLPDKDVEITKTADALKSDSEIAQQAIALKEEIELESMVIAAKDRELTKLQKELEILKAKASLDGGFKFRSAIVTVPYAFIREAVESSKKLIPKKNRQERLIQLLDKETREMDELKAQLKAINHAIDVKTDAVEESDAAAQKAPTSLADIVAEAMPSDKAATEPEVPTVVEETVQAVEEPAPAVEEQQIPEEALALQAEIETLSGRLEVQKRLYEEEKTVFETQVRAVRKELDDSEVDDAIKKQQKSLTKREVKLRSELKDIEDDIKELIEKENHLEEEELSILEKRIKKIDKVVSKVQSRAVAQDLLEERSRLEDRLLQIELRRDFLTREMDRFQIRKNP